METNRVDIYNPKSNMYGCLPCPKCNSKFRWPSGKDHPQYPLCIICDDCGFKEKTKIK